MRSVQTRVLRIDRDEHLHDMIFGQTVEDDRRNGELFTSDVLDVRVQRQKTMLAVDRAQDTFALRDLETSHSSPRLDRFEGQFLVAGDDDGAGDGRKVARLPTLLVVLHQFVNLSTDNLTLVGLLTRSNAAFEKVPVDLRRHLFLPAPNTRLARFAVVQYFEPNELVDIAGSQGCLIEVNPELLHPNRRHVDH